MKVRFALALILAALSLSNLFATQSANLAGSWAIEARETVSGSDGTTTRLVAIAGTLTLEQKGDAVTGSWQGRLPQPWALSGTVKGSAFELQTETRDIPITRNGEPQTMRRRWIFTGTVDGNTLSGSMQLAGGEGDAPSQPFSATRK